MALGIESSDVPEDEIVTSLIKAVELRIDKAQQDGIMGRECLYELKKLKELLISYNK